MMHCNIVRRQETSSDLLLMSIEHDHGSYISTLKYTQNGGKLHIKDGDDDACLQAQDGDDSICLQTKCLPQLFGEGIFDLH